LVFTQAITLPMVLVILYLAPSAKASTIVRRNVKRRIGPSINTSASSINK
jgi:hypothetical protein